MNTQRLRRVARDERGYGAITYFLVTGPVAVLALQPSLIVAAVGRLSDLFDLFMGQLRFLGFLRFLF